MGKKLLKNPTVYAIQNGLAACLFLLLFTHEVLAYLLYTFPTSEILWMLTLNTSRLVGPFTYAIEPYFQLPYALMILYACAVIVPTVAYRYRNWFGTAVSGHIALGAFAKMTYTAMMWSHMNVATASLSRDFGVRDLNGSIAAMLMLTAVMATLCMLNHIMFFSRIKQR